ncbi:MAG: DUF1552 domain-containing protein, partial [Verrucomicrobiota bacterium]
YERSKYQSSELKAFDLTRFKLPRSIEPLERYKDRTTLLPNLERGVLGPGNHSYGFGALGCFPWRNGASAETIDWALAKTLPAPFPRVGLGATSRGGAVTFDMSAMGKGRKLPTIVNPAMAYEQLFGAVINPSAKKHFVGRSNVLDFLADDVRRLQQALPAEEVQKLDYYLDAFESMSKRGAEIRKVADRIRKAAPEKEDELYQSERLLDRLQAMFDQAGAALIAGLTNVAVIESSVSHPGGAGLGHIDGAQIGVKAPKISLHGVGHGESFGGLTSKEIMIEVRRKHMGMVVGLLDRLATVPEGDGTMLDNTLLVFTSDYGPAHHPGNPRKGGGYPYILVGDLGGRLMTRGRCLLHPSYGESKGRSMANLYTTFLHAAGAPVDHFGMKDPNLPEAPQNGVIDELLA